jgi:amino acid permease
METRQLTFWEATSLMVGAGVGAGIMAVPYLASRAGLATLVVVLAIAYAATCLIHLMLAEVLFRTGRDLQVIELMRLYVFRGRAWSWLLWLVFALLSVAFVAVLAAYVSGEGEIVTKFTGLPGGVSELVVYAVSAGVVFFGLKVVGVFEKLGAFALVACVVALAIGSIGVGFHLDVAPSGSWTESLALYGMVMYGYYTFFTVPQVVRGLGPDRRAAVRAIVLGLAINGLLMAVVAFIALGVSGGDVTKVAIIGIADSIGSWAGSVGSLFILVALVTSYWSVSLALADILRERTGMHRNLSWLLATLPSLLLLYAGAWRFLEWLRLAGGATAIVIALITIPMYVNARRFGDVPAPGWSLGRWGNPVMLALALLAAVLMAVGSLLQL